MTNFSAGVGAATPAPVTYSTGNVAFSKIKKTPPSVYDLSTPFLLPAGIPDTAQKSCADSPASQKSPTQFNHAGVRDPRQAISLRASAPYRFFPGSRLEVMSRVRRVGPPSLQHAQHRNRQRRLHASG